MPKEITPAKLANYLEKENPPKCRGQYHRFNASCAGGWASTLNGNVFPKWLTTPIDGKYSTWTKLVQINDTTARWTKVIEFLRTLKPNGQPKVTR